MRLYVLLILISIVCIGLYMMYEAQWSRVQIEIGPGARARDEGPPIVLPDGRCHAVVASGSEVVTLEILRPAGAPTPVVFVVGAAGSRSASGAARARELHDHSFTVVRVLDAALPAEARAPALADAIEYVRRIKNVAAEYIGVVAFEDSAPMALVAASLARHLRALALHNLSMPNGMQRRHARDLPRTLLLIDETEAAAVAARFTLEMWFRDFDIPYSIEMLADDGVPSETRAWSRMVGFLREYLPPVD